MTELESAHNCNSCLTGPQPAALPIKLHPHGDEYRNRTCSTGVRTQCATITPNHLETAPRFERGILHLQCSALPLGHAVWWTIWDSNPSVILSARQAATPSSPTAHKKSIKNPPHEMVLIISQAVEIFSSSVVFH